MIYLLRVAELFDVRVNTHESNIKYSNTKDFCCYYILNFFAVYDTITCGHIKLYKNK
jgi:hypothetical protein